MKIKDTKRTFFMYLPYECTAVEEYLEQMAEKGWLVHSVKRNFFKFKRIEPKKIKYLVNLLRGVSIFDLKDNVIALKNREYCEATGWNYVCQDGKIQIFYAEDDKEAIPIHTDAEEKFKSVLEDSLFNVVGRIFFIFMCILNVYNQLFKGDIEFTLASNFGIFSVVLMIPIIFISSIGVINFFLWRIKARGQLKENKFLPYNNYKQLRIKNIFIKIYMLIIIIILFRFTILNNYTSRLFDVSLLMIVFIPAIIMICVQKFINKKRYSKNINMAITIGSTFVSIFLVLGLVGHFALSSITEIRQNKVQNEKANLTLMDFGYKENQDVSSYNSNDKSILAEKIEYSYSDKDKSLSYTIFQSQYSWVIKSDENRLLSRLNKYDIYLKHEDTNLPSDIKVYSDSEKRYFVLVSENKIVHIRNSFNEINEEEFLDKVFKKLFS